LYARQAWLSSRRSCAIFGGMTPDLSIVVLSWNVADLLAACLRSLPSAAGDWWQRVEVLVVDNASTDDSPELVRREFPYVRLLALPTNRGFSAGNNVGIRASRGKYILLLNPDTVAHPGSIAALADYMRAYPDVGVAGPRLLNPDGSLQPSRRRFPSLMTAVIESTPLQQWFPDALTLRQFYMLDQSDDDVQDVGWLSGAALMCRQDALRQAGLLDPGYFMFSEEVDLCRRLNYAGWRIAYVPRAEITHYGGQSTAQDVPARHVHFNTNKARYFRIHEGRAIGKTVRLYLLGVYVGQTLSEAAKWVVGHKRPLRASRMRMYAQVLKSGLRESRPPLGGHRVLLITGEYPPAQGGVGDYTCRLGLALEERGVALRVLTRRRDIPFSSTPPVRQPKVALPLLAHRIMPSAVLNALRGTRSRVAHIQYQTGAYEMRPTINFLPLLLRRLWGGKTVVTFHDLLVPYLFPKAGPVREWVTRLLARTVDAVIATNPEDAEQLRSWGVRRLELIPIGSNISNNPPKGFNRDAWRARFGLGSDTTLLAYFGFLNSSKGLDDLLRALAVLRENGDYRLLMVGGGIGSSDPTNRATAAYLDNLAKELGVHGDLIWTGFLAPQEVSAALLSADMAVLPYAEGASFRRGSLMAVLEHGLPLVTTYPPTANPKLKIQNPKSKIQNPEWPQLRHRDNAFLVPAGDSSALAYAVRQVAGDDDLRERLGAGARSLAAFFGWSHIATMHLHLYDELIGP